ncbi:hypothetical protein [Pedobacter sp. KBW01]|uniref:hypothetical protein n=1 Tax=Pedobacter sp. KBW01 TaxID=2153364 RepID=UPI000F5921E4|nr:hypothetical protein [Pedobacter sp. KBW01]
MLSTSRLITFLLVLLCVMAKAQDHKLDSVATNLNNYGLSTARSNLFVHFDKNVYTNNDQVWFTGYLLKAVTDMKQYHTLYLSLVNNRDSSVVYQGNFLIDKGFCYGALNLPDSLLGGAYRFVVNTNITLNGKPDAEFIQPVTIKSTTLNSLVDQVSVFKTYDEHTGNGTVLLKILTSENRFVEDAQIKYQIGRGKQVLKSAVAKSSVIGELMIDYPADKITAANNLLAISIKKGSHTRYVKFELPVRNKPKYDVRFYPEGGYLITDLLTKVGFEIKDGTGAGIKARGILYEDDAATDTIATSSMGIGTFFMMPKPLKRYTVKLLADGQQGTIYDLPLALNKGVALSTASAIGNNEFKTQLETNFNTKVHVLVHNFSDIFLQTTLALAVGKMQSIKFNLDSVPVGLHTITVLDSNYKPLAERIFFAHYDQINTVSVEPDKNEYSTRERVELKLNITDKDNKPVTGLISIACVQANRLLLGNNTTIVDSFYLNDNLPDFPNNSFGLKYGNKNYLNDVLLVKGWRRYKWPEAELVKSETTKLLSSLEYEGSILKKKKPLDAPMSLTTIAGTNLNFLSTDSSGKFSVPFANLLTKEVKPNVWLSMATAKHENYELKINEPQKTIKTYLGQQDFVQPVSKTGVADEYAQSITSTAGIKLKEVVINNTKDNSTSFSRKGHNRCGDYVCRYNILNCPNHFGDFDSHEPVKGKSYKVGGTGGLVVYQGCTDEESKPNLVILKGINLPKEFYISDVLNKNEPINFATVYWNYQVLVNGETPLSFNTGDITGKFKIIVQGVTDKGVVYGEKEITVTVNSK